MAAGAERRFAGGAGYGWVDGRLSLLVIFAVAPALVIQGWNEYDLRLAHDADISQQVVQTTKQFGEEIGELREGGSPLLMAIAQLNTVKTQQTVYCNALFSKLKSRFINYGVLGAAETQGQVLLYERRGQRSLGGRPALLYVRNGATRAGRGELLGRSGNRTG
jgi:hypothetical protein